MPHGSRTLRIASALLLWLAASPVASPADTNPGFVELPLELGRLFVPSGAATENGAADLLVHFHGHPPVVCSNFLAAGLSAPLVVINFSGLSAAYARPFADPNRFSQVLSNTTETLTRHFGRPCTLRRLAVSSFSAGYGAVRELLKHPLHADRISNLVLADSLYAGYVTQEGRSVPDPQQMQGFIRFARHATNGKARFILTHSQQVPGTYASTRETADAILSAIGLARTPASTTNSTGMQLESVADAGGFLLRSYAGDQPRDHMSHLRHMAAALRLTSLASSNLTAEP